MICDRPAKPKATVQDALHVPLFDWTNTPFDYENPDFVSKVSEKISKSSAGIICLHEPGLRATQALMKLHKAGFRSLALVQGNFDSIKSGGQPFTVNMPQFWRAGGRNATLAGWHGFST